MGAKQLTFDADARAKIKSGVQKLAKAVKVTYGPRGRNAVIDRGWGAPNVTKDGVTVAEEVSLSDLDRGAAVKIATMFPHDLRKFWPRFIQTAAKNRQEGAA